MLASSPVGFLFHTDRVSVPGCSTCVRDDEGFPDVDYGSALRLVFEGSDPVKGRLITDLGQAEQFGHPHKQDQVPRWSAGDLPILAVPRRDVEDRLEGWAVLNPAP